MRWVQPLLLVAAAVACDASASQLWCRQDSDCHTYNDVGAKCQQDACVCSAGFAHVAPDVSLCTRGSSAVREVVRVMFPLTTKCSKSSSVELALRTAVTAAAGGTAVSTSVECSPYHVLADVTLMTEDLSALHALSLEAVTQELQKTEYRVLQDFNMTQPTHVGVRRVWELRCEPLAHAVEMAYRYPDCVVTECEAGFVPGLLDLYCELAPPVPSPAPASTPRPSLPVSVRLPLQCRVDHAARTHYADHACVVEACDAGYKVSHDARSCEPGEADGGDDGLSGGAIAGIVCGTVVGVALLVAVACLLMSRASASRNREITEPQNA